MKRWFGWRVSMLRLAHGERIPRGYGIAWWDASTHEGVVLPLGLHWIVGGLRAAYWWAVSAYIPEPVERAYKAGWDAACAMEDRRRAMLEHSMRESIRVDEQRRLNDGIEAAIRHSFGGRA